MGYCVARDDTIGPMPNHILKQTINFALGSLVGNLIFSFLSSYIWYKYDPVIPSADFRFLLSLLITAIAFIVSSGIFLLGLLLTKRMNEGFLLSHSYWSFSLGLGLLNALLPLLIPEFLPDIFLYVMLSVFPLLSACLLRLIINLRETSNRKSRVSPSPRL